MLLHWIWFAELKDISLLHKHRLLERFGDPEELYRMSEEALLNAGLPEKERNALLDKNLWKAEQITERCTKRDIGVLPVADSAYPKRLRNSADAPIVLYYRGVLPDWDANPFIGVVGTRKASAYGLQVAHQLGSQIATCGGFVVSGGAAGGDTAAMQGAMSAGYPVVGVLGCGVDVVYPHSNRKLFEKIVTDGCLISEYPPGTEPKPWHFSARNRIISGVSNGVLVVEAPKSSGALITARHALEQGRDVFVVPGNINSPTCEGSNALLQEGAAPVLSGWDVVSGYEFLYPGKLQKNLKVSLYTGEETLAQVAQTPAHLENSTNKSAKSGKIPIDNGEKSPYIELVKNQPALDEEEQAVLACLTESPQQASEVMAALDMPSGKVLSVLTMLTVKGYAKKHPGGSYSMK